MMCRKSKMIRKTRKWTSTEAWVDHSRNQEPCTIVSTQGPRRGRRRVCFHDLGRVHTVSFSASTSGGRRVTTTYSNTRVTRGWLSKTITNVVHDAMVQSLKMLSDVSAGENCWNECLSEWKKNRTVYRKKWVRARWRGKRWEEVAREGDSDTSNNMLFEGSEKNHGLPRNLESIVD